MSAPSLSVHADGSSVIDDFVASDDGAAHYFGLLVTTAIKCDLSHSLVCTGLFADFKSAGTHVDLLGV